MLIISVTRVKMTHNKNVLIVKDFLSGYFVWFHIDIIALFQRTSNLKFFYRKRIENPKTFKIKSFINFKIKCT